MKSFYQVFSLFDRIVRRLANHLVASPDRDSGNKRNLFHSWYHSLNYEVVHTSMKLLMCSCEYSWSNALYKTLKCMRWSLMLVISKYSFVSLWGMQIEPISPISSHWRSPISGLFAQHVSFLEYSLALFSNPSTQKNSKLNQ